MKCLILFSGKNKKNITNLSSAELAYRVVKVNKTTMATIQLVKVYTLVNMGHFKRKSVFKHEQMCRFRSSCACAKYHPCLLLFIHTLCRVSNNFVSGQ